MRAGHFTEEDLIALADAPATTNEHMTSCTECRAKLDSFRSVMCGLKDESVWNDTPLREAPVPQTIANLRAFADRMASEDAQAETYVRDLLEGPRERWMPKLQLHPEYRTAGVVRKLIESTTHAIDTMPPDAVAMTTLATEIADHLDPAAYTSDTVPRLRGAAWRERAYALFYTGRLGEAEEASRVSESNLSDCLIDEYESARLGIVRALILRAMEKYPLAITVARQSALTFGYYADVNRGVAAALAEAHLLFSCGQYTHALERLLDANEKVRDFGDAETHARVLANLGYCYWKLGRFEDALRYHDAAASLFDDLNIKTEVLRLRWSVASILAAAGRVDEALDRLKIASGEFGHLGMTSVSTLVRLEIAELLLERGEVEKVEAICRDAMREFEAAGLSHTVRALTALAFMHESTQKRTVTPALVRHVRDYLERIPREENLVFLPPPS